MTREQRLKDREEKRRLHEQQLAEMEEQAKKLETGEARVSERQLKAMMEKGKQDLEALQLEEPWTFDCSVCGVHGENLDDGSHSVACEKCNVWQHSHCLGIAKEEAEKDDFHFICADCQRRIEEAKRPKLPLLKFRIPTPASPPSAEGIKANEEKQKRQPGPGSPIKKPKKPRAAVVIPSQPGVLQPTNAPGMRPGVNGAVPAHQQGVYPAAGLFSAGAAQKLPLSIPNDPLHRQSQPQHLASTTAQPEQPLTFIQHYPPPTVPHSTATSFNSQRPSSSYSTHNSYPSPIQNRPSMSPTQGNHDVGPLVGFPQPGAPNGSVPSTPFHRNQAHPASSPYINQTPSASFSSTTPHASFAHTPPPSYSQPVAMSGLSPTKHSPPRGPPTFSPSVGSASVLPPVQKLHPSPKLMGRSSPDAPVPGPIKSMTPEQEDRRRRELQLSAQHLGQMRPMARPFDTSVPRPPAFHTAPSQHQPHQSGTPLNGSFNESSSQ